jgi:hypothetical protein
MEGGKKSKQFIPEKIVIAAFYFHNELVSFV